MALLELVRVRNVLIYSGAQSAGNIALNPSLFKSKRDESKKNRYLNFIVTVILHCVAVFVYLAFQVYYRTPLIIPTNYRCIYVLKRAIRICQQLDYRELCLIYNGILPAKIMFYFQNVCHNQNIHLKNNV